ncbi:VOC family protein [Streptosporangium pseudovulgare]|uniref:Hydrolase n=1 Tax=Streptosporangium pseudovulgare TaxID=35765 RepID=A0ABQ2RA58_9ACTN|nr:VOC family protein [Streptosporangium pseudovulgare]GGQ16238.1 hydrolase [Streptosporangium pseudovulgare]
MSERSGCKSGVPCWVELSSADVTLSVRFYREVFGWEAVFDPRPESGGYGRFTLGGRAVAGVGPGSGDGVPSVWNTYVATDDAGVTALKVRAAGGEVVCEPAEVFGEGVAAAFQDPWGAVFAAWQPGLHRGAEVTGEPGAFAWSELVTADPRGCDPFYASVFGWSRGDGGTGGADGTDAIGGPDGDRVEWRVDGRPVAGASAAWGPLPPGAPPYWLACFAVEDVGEAVARIVHLGGSVETPPATTPAGRTAVVADPQAALFAVVGPREATG